MRRLLFSLVATASLSACVGPEDSPSQVHDLRVLGVRLDSPELLAPTCPDLVHPESIQPTALLPFLERLEYRALIVDPKGNGRNIDWELYACARFGDRNCSEVEDRNQLARGVTHDGVLELTLDGLALTQLPGPDRILDDPNTVQVKESDDDRFLIQRVLELDQYRGLGGARVPLVLHVKAGDEEIWASKLMVFNCNFFPGATPTMSKNVNPELPGVTLRGTEWAEDEIPLLEGPGPFKMEPVDFEALQEPYIVPSFSLKPVALTESWRIAWHADLGRFSSNVTGGEDPGGGEVRHRVEWTPPKDAQEQDVRFWMVVRDGRGGLSWISRRAHYKP